MSNIITTYQEESKLKKTNEKSAFFGTVTEVNVAGLKVRFDGESTASSKRYPRNIAITFQVGQRVLIEKINGSYIVICPIG